jgi:hypothetical protein
MSPLRHHFEHAIPSEFGKLGDMGVKHVHAWKFVTKFQDAALSLSLDDRVRELAGGEASAGGVILEEICVKVKGVDQIELQNIHEIDAHCFPDVDLDRMVLVVKGNPVDRVKVICVIEVNVDAVMTITIS